nr:MAG TPA: hypothetical protein [Bacteriophage sp.]DAM36268.1 MAG TPA: hypothetical protein [Caudoviricetes sp.]DAV93300.1 MAG TPA: hypothetical protein [Caudoviricetes sp.]
MGKNTQLELPSNKKFIHKEWIFIIYKKLNSPFYMGFHLCLYGEQHIV